MARLNWILVPDIIFYEGSFNLTRGLIVYKQASYMSRKVRCFTHAHLYLWAILDETETMTTFTSQWATICQMTAPNQELQLDELRALVDFVLKNSYKARDTDIQVGNVYFDRGTSRLVYTPTQMKTLTSWPKPSLLYVSFTEVCSVLSIVGTYTDRLNTNQPELVFS